MRGRSRAETLHNTIPQTAATKAARAGETCNAAWAKLYVQLKGQACTGAWRQRRYSCKLCGEAGRALRWCAAAKKRGA
eukprot:5621078-Prymnesium_polylepis.1